MEPQRVFARPPEAATRQLLESCQLPTADATAAHFESFFGVGNVGAPSGVVGVELCGAVALLRSLAVAEGARGQGLGRALVSEAEGFASSHGVREIYLLTDQAEEFFASLGYRRVQRDRAPRPIVATAEFSALCPASSALMMKRL